MYFAAIATSPMPRTTQIVYFIQAGTDGPVKIGFSQNFEVRFNALKRQNHNELTVLRTIPGDRLSEERFLFYFAHLRIRGDWFSYHPAMLTLTVDQIERDKLLRVSAVREWRARLGFSQTEAAKALGYSTSRFCVYDQGKESPPRKMLIAMRGIEYELMRNVAA